MNELAIIAVLTALIYFILTVLRERKDKIASKESKAFLDEIDKRNGN